MALFEFRCDPPTACLQISGELDLGTGSELSAAFERLFVDGCDHVVLALDGVLFVDAYSLGLLDKEKRRLASQGGDLTVLTASERFRRVALLAGYDELQPAS